MFAYMKLDKELSESGLRILPGMAEMILGQQHLLTSQWRLVGIMK